jgi:antirestriction protein ArdC
MFLVRELQTQRRAISGINILMLWGFAVLIWMTFKQVSELGLSCQERRGGSVLIWVIIYFPYQDSVTMI